MNEDLDKMGKVSSEYADWEIDPQESFEQSVQEGRFLGMSPGRRFLIAFLIFVVVLVGGTLCLLATGKLWLY
jgi:hypothetical protein